MLNKAGKPNQDVRAKETRFKNSPFKEYSAENMAFDSDWDSRSVDSRPSDFNDGAEAILMNTDLMIEAHRGREGDDRCTTPEGHIDYDYQYAAHGQGAPAYSCGCYNYSMMERYKSPKTSPPGLEQVCLSCR
jgi:hypothetical protein